MSAHAAEPGSVVPPMPERTPKALRTLGDEEAAEAQLRVAREHLASLGARGLVDEIDRELAAIGEGAGHAGPLASS